ncbi:MAG TPA: thiamine pyrophosphate-dependent enzyme [Myxococcota bacterium]|nr:thiamine pyrophosphate-dependent enzyme [Myxococcota bacterium]
MVQEFSDSISEEAWISRWLKERAKLKASFSEQEKERLYKGMVLTRAVDNGLKQLFLSGEITYGSRSFQGKGFRSLGQEAIYGAPLRLRTGSGFIDNGVYTGDFAAPLIRDLGIFLFMSDDDVVAALNAQAGKSGPPCDGRDFHVGDFSRGLLIAAAPLAIATSTLLGLALAFKRRQEPRVAVSFIGDGGTSLGEWHEAINFAAVHSLPMIFCVQNNQMALSTPRSIQSRARSFADKALGYGIRALTIDGNDVLEVASAFAFAANLARSLNGPVLLELETMRMCGHAHHDDMLYLGADPTPSFSIGKAKPDGYVDQKLFEKWRALDPITRYETKLIEEGLLTPKKAQDIKNRASERVREGILQVKARPWPRLIGEDNDLVFKKPIIFATRKQQVSRTLFAKDGVTYLQAICEGVRQSFLTHKNCLMIGEDVAPPYGNAFMMFKPIMNEFTDRFVNTPIGENAIVGACVGLALSSMLPIGEIQFNDFVACAMDQVVNNAAKTFFRLNLSVPLVLRLPYGGLRRAGPFHSQDTSPWFFRTAGLKIMAPSTPLDAMLMLQRAVNDPDPVLFYEHIALYRDARIKQRYQDASEHNIDGASLVHKGDRLSIISYGAYVHVARQVAESLDEEHGLGVDVLDLRYLIPIDFASVYESVKKTGRVLLVTEDSKTGSILESVASNIGEELFSFLDAPVTVLGSRDIPVPYAPSLEQDYLLSERGIKDAALKLIAF